ncbi:MAG: glycerol kinase GlpK [Lachnospiraceae bacterium]|nr:glycerol kinase GlpK [Lachnospiraceae bacterium]
MQKKYILALDEGTTSARAILFDRDMRIVSMAQNEIRQIFPKPGWVEQDPLDIYVSQYAAMTECIAKSGIGSDEIAALGITNQRETVVAWSRTTGKPLANAIVWQCRRTADICGSLVKNGYSEYIRNTTGLRADPYFSGTKIKWMLDNVPEVRHAADSGDLMLGTVDTWLTYKLTEGRSFITDRTNASRTMLCNIFTGKWDGKMLGIFGIPASSLPEIKSSSELFGYVDCMGASIPIAGIAGDQQAALFGQGCFRDGEAKNTYGTGCFLLMNTGQKPIRSDNGLVTTIAWGIDGKVTYSLEGSIFVAGAAIQWLRDEMGLIESAADSEHMARKVSDTNGCYVVPAFTGLGAPYWDQYARGVIVGLTRGVNRYHIIRATLESIAYSTYEVLGAMEADSGIRLESLRVDGGASANDFLMQQQADIANAPVQRPVCIESTALGAAYLAGLATGFWKDTEDILSNRSIDKVFEPSITDEERQSRLAGWRKAVKRANDWAREDEC